MSECTAVSERWKPVMGFHDIYEVSDHGRVRSLDRTGWDRLGRKRTFHGRVLAAALSRRHKRLYVALCMDGRQCTQMVHRLVLTAFVGPCPPGLEGCHSNGIATDNRLVNLRWDTHEANIQDLVRHGMHPKRQRTVCPLHHRLVPPNLIAAMISKGHRACLACDRGRGDVRYARRRGRDCDLRVAADAHYAKIMGGITAC